MTPDRYKRVKEVFLALAEQPPTERTAFLDRLCGGDAELRQEVEALISSDVEGSMGLPVRPPAATRASDGASKRVADSRPPVDSITGYEIMREIHTGGQGMVYQAIHRSTRRKVAIKVMREGPFASAREKTRFEREVHVLSQLNHPNIVTILDSGVAMGSAYFVMDYVSGHALDEYFNAESRRAARAARNARVRRDELRSRLQMFAKVCEAVNAAHLRGVIHRDLKPSNIRVDSDGEPHILDFGLAKTVGGDGEPPGAMTMTGQFFGSLPWASPEQAEAVPGKIDIRTDVYSLGVILYQLVTGKFPYVVTGSMGDVLGQITRSEPARPSAASPDIDDELETIILKCLQKERERRYQSAGELMRDVGHYLADEPIEAKRDSGLYVLRKFLRRYRAPAAVGAAFIILVSASAAVAVGLWRTAARERDRAREAEVAARNSAESAERALNVASEGANLLLFGICRELPSVPGNRELQISLLDKARTHYEKLVSERPHDPAERRLIWVSFQELGDAYDALGKLEQARASYTQFHRMAADAHNAHPEDPAFARDLAASYGRLGTIELKSENPAGAEKHVFNQLRLAETWHEKVPDDARFKEEIASACGRLADVEDRRKKTPKADEYSKRELLIARSLLESAPAEPRYQRLVLAACRSLAARNRDDDGNSAAIYLEEAGRIITREDSIETLGARSRFDVAATLHLMGDHARKDRRNDDAMRFFEQAEALLESLIAWEPDHADCIDRLMAVYIDLGDAMLQARDFVAADNYYRKQIQLGERTLERGRTPSFLRAKLVIGYLQIGDLHRRLLDFESSLTFLERARKMSEALYKAEPENNDFNVMYARSYEWLQKMELARLKAGDGDPGASEKRILDLGVRQLEIRREAADRPDAQAAVKNAFAWALLTARPESIRNAKDALRYVEEAIRLSEKESPYFNDTLALALHMNGRHAEAVETAKRAIELLQPDQHRHLKQFKANLRRFEAAARGETPTSAPVLDGEPPS